MAAVSMPQPGQRVVVQDKRLGFVHGVVLETLDDDDLVVIEAEIEGFERDVYQFPRRKIVRVDP
jgi:hypothetical protein